MRAGIFFFSALLTPSLAFAAQAVPAASCSSPGYRQFDFWVGTWAVSEFDGSPPEAEVIVTPVQDGCALREQYRALGGAGTGESLTMYDPRTDLWRQSWVTNKNQILLVEGKFKNGAITMTGPEYGDIDRRIVHVTWAKARDGVRENAVRSTDGGKSWTPWFDLIFRAKT